MSPSLEDKTEAHLRTPQPPLLCRTVRITARRPQAARPPQVTFWPSGAPTARDREKPQGSEIPDAITLDDELATLSSPVGFVKNVISPGEAH